MPSKNIVDFAYQVRDYMRSAEVVASKNLLDNIVTSGTVNDVTVTVNTDKSITLNGTVGSDVDQYGYSYIDVNVDLSFLEVGKTYVISGCPADGSADTFYIQLQKTSPSLADMGSGASFTVASGQTYSKVRILMKQGFTFNNHVFKPMICTLADWNVSHTYEPYHYTVSEQLTTKISGKKVAGTVSSTSVTFTDSALTSDSIIDGPYVAGYVMGIASVTPSTGSVTFTFTSADADGETAYIWIR